MTKVIQPRIISTRSATTEPGTADIFLSHEFLENPRDPALDLISKLAANSVNAQTAMIVATTDETPCGEVGMTDDLIENREFVAMVISKCRLDDIGWLGPSDSSDGLSLRSLSRNSDNTSDSYINAPISLPDGERVGVLCVMDTIPRCWSDREASIVQSLACLAAEVLRLRSKSHKLGRTLTSIVHDLRSPLHTISICSGIAQHNDCTHSTLTHAIHRIDLACNIMSRMLGNLHQVKSRINVGPVVLGQISLVKLLDDAVAMLSPIAEQVGIRLSCELIDPDITAIVDYGQIMRVFSNLVENALKFSPRGSLVLIRGSLEPCQVRFTVQDEGCGINPADALHIFEEYWTKDSVPGRGAGLGLYICKEIVLLHGGDIALVDSNNGCRFEFTIPLHATGANLVNLEAI